MNRHVNAIAGRLSLRAPQRHSLEVRCLQPLPMDQGYVLSLSPGKS
jgi:hypothetical protein